MVIKNGSKFGRLTAIKQTKFGRKSRWLFKCDCGKKKEARTDSVKSGKQKSCGCLIPYLLSKKRGELNTNYKHGHTSKNGLVKITPTFRSWTMMKVRCLNKNHDAYPYYGGRGIKICPRWLSKNGFVNFLEDMGNRPTGTSLDRIDSDGDYEPKNCQWSTKSVQMKNRRKWKIS